MTRDDKDAFYEARKDADFKFDYMSIDDAPSWIFGMAPIDAEGGES